jgi:flagellar motor switch protein FliN
MTDRATAAGASAVASLAAAPAYARSLLRIEVPVVVTLAGRRQPVEQIINLSPGSILQFSKACDEPLEIAVGGRTVALGEAVKVGDKYGVRLTQMVLPDERLLPLRALPARGNG